MSCTGPSGSGTVVVVVVLLVVVLLVVLVVAVVDVVVVVVVVVVVEGGGVGTPVLRSRVNPPLLVTTPRSTSPSASTSVAASEPGSMAPDPAAYWWTVPTRPECPP